MTQQTITDLTPQESRLVVEEIQSRVRDRLIGGPDASPIFKNPPSKRFLTGTLFPATEDIDAQSDDDDAGNAAPQGTQGRGRGRGGEEEEEDTIFMGNRRALPQRVGLMFFTQDGASGQVDVDLRFDVWRRTEPEDDDRDRYEYLDTVSASDTLDLADLEACQERLTADVQAQLDGLSAQADTNGRSPDWRAEVSIRRRQHRSEVRYTVELINKTPRPTGPGSKWVCPEYFRPHIRIGFRDCLDTIVPRHPKQFRAKSKRRNVYEPLGHGIGCVAEGEYDDASLETNLIPVHRQLLIEQLQRPGTGIDELAADPLAAVAAFVGEMETFLGEWDQIRDDLGLEGDDLKGFESDRASFESEINACRQTLAHLEGDANVLKAFKATFDTQQRIAEARRKGGGSRAPITNLYPFQLGYLLSSIPDVVARAQARRNHDASLRLDADLIWFPTGGGKTEAFQALALFTAFHDRFEGKHRGITAWLRFALRGLTYQQTGRLLELVYHAEVVRIDHKAGPASAAFRLGLHIGGSHTPNEIKFRGNSPKHRSQTRSFIEQEIDNKDGKAYLFTPTCPACYQDTIRSSFDEDEWDITYACSNPACGAQMPLTVVDEAMRRWPPAFMVSTIDKVTGLGLRQRDHVFVRSPKYVCPEHGAVKPWRSGRRLTHGKDWNTNQTCPEEMQEVAAEDWGPSLVITDEVHLLEEELGTFSSHYDSLHRELQRSGGFPAAKQVLASATVAGFEKHIRHLTGLEARRFPSEVPRQGYGFYYRTLDDVKRVFLGVHPHGLTESNAILYCLRAIVSTLRSLRREGAMNLDSVLGRQLTDEERSHMLRPYYVTIPYIMALAQGDNIKHSMEGQMPLLMDEIGEEQVQSSDIISSRLEATELTEVLNQLEARDYPDFEVAPASRSIANGVDIQNVNSMVLVGQPRRTSEDIQVTSRTGRRLAGFVLRLYHPVRERDQTHYRLFHHYHRNQDLLVEAVPINRYSSMSAERTMAGVFMAALYDQDASRDFRVSLARRPEDAQKLLRTPGVADDIRDFVLRTYDAGEKRTFKATVESEFEDHLARLHDLRSSVGDWTTDRFKRRPMTSLRDVEPGVDIYHGRGFNRIQDELGITGMSRSRVQVLLGHTPQANFNYQGGKSIVQADFIQPDQDRGDLDDFDVAAVFPKIWHLVHGVPEVRNQLHTHGWDRAAETFHLVRPGAVRVRFHPTVVECQRCRHVWQVDADRGGLKCPQGGCLGQGSQVRHVAVHACGNLMPLRVIKCRTHSQGRLVFDRTSMSSSDWQWECKEPGCGFTQKHYQKCFHCDGGTA